MKLDRKTKRQLTRIERHAEALADAIGDLLHKPKIRSELLLDGLVIGSELASAIRVVLNRPATFDEERQAKALLAREKRAARRRAA